MLKSGLRKNLVVVGLLASAASYAQSPAELREDEAVGESINYVFAADLGSGVYDLDGRTLQIYQLTYSHDFREAAPGQLGLRFEVPFTFGFFDFKPVDVLSQGIPDRVDSYSIVPGVKFDHMINEEWHLIPYVRAGFSVASSSVDGWLYGAGVQLEHRGDFHGWDNLSRSELAFSGVEYRGNVPNDRFVRLRQGFDFTRSIGWRFGGERTVELGLYNIVDVIIDPPTSPVTNARNQAMQFEFGFTFATRPRYKVWLFDVPRLGFGYRMAGELSAWRLVIGKPF